jgi:hypothetical protein
VEECLVVKKKNESRRQEREAREKKSKPCEWVKVLGFPCWQFHTEQSLENEKGP